MQYGAAKFLASRPPACSPAAITETEDAMIPSAEQIRNVFKSPENGDRDTSFTHVANGRIVAARADLDPASVQRRFDENPI